MVSSKATWVFVRLSTPWSSGEEVKMTKTMDWIDKIVRAHGDECVFWPFARCPNGYGKLRRDKRWWLAHRFVCTLVHGNGGETKPLVLHSCGNGHLGCVNPGHLRWGTAKENTRDALDSGTFALGERANKSGLTADGVRQMRKLRLEGIALQPIADKFGVSLAAASLAIRGKTWAHV